MGVSGCGKTTVGTALADALGGTFADGDDFHSAANRTRMRAGIPLTDADRGPWLKQLNAWLRKSNTIESGPVVLACSALKTAYRETLSRGLDSCAFLFLKVDPKTLQTRMKKRTDHFMPVALLRSQLETLEPPGPEALTVEAALPINRIVTEALHGFGFADEGAPNRP